ncbi:family 78 glycoside hydrolase catalytic domain [Kutzneria sp. CA-103260]|uniref:family 78 glycoside hydrolase catalytic domain n=1 Tax=Kutzneria sp. CA-103260 TaxID=2802641 RepID=UPI002011FF24|nr:family 78 glycoside hydrolase catalytic domain [Kutzneria sp. CA-103260]
MLTRFRAEPLVRAMAVAFLLVAAGTAPAVAAPAELVVQQVQAETKAGPPTFSWQLGSAVNGERQTAYRVRVSAGTEVWDSGRVASAASVGVPYGGPVLQAGRAYTWTVQVWDAHGRPSAWSKPQPLAVAPTDWQGAQWISPDSTTSWSNFVLDTDFTIKAAAAGVVFRAQDSANYYLWQINTVTTPGKVMLRPHVQVGGHFTTLAEVDLSPVLTPANAGTSHHLQIRADGATITTTIDGTQVDVRTDTSLTQGTIGFRTSTSAGVAEDAVYDNLALHGLDGTSLFADDFSRSPDPRFAQQKIVDGQLEPSGDPVLLGANHAAPMLRRTFTLTKPIAHADVNVLGLGFYELHLNGAKVGDAVLTPADAPYDRRDLYDTYDVTGQLKPGANAVGMMLGNGYGQHFSPYGFRWLGPEQAIMTLTVTYTDGTQQAITTDHSWTWSDSPITGDDIYNGETYDARQEQHGWDTAGFDASTWRPVTTVAAPAGTLTPSTLPPIRVVQTLRPVKMTQPSPGVYVYDLGQNIAGWARIRAKGPAGTQIQLRTAEELTPDGRLDTTTNRNAAATDTFVLAGTGGTESYEPRFDYHGFRYVEVTGYPGTPTVDSLDGRVAHADVASTGSFTSSDPTLNQLWQNNRWSILNNSMSVPTDNPVRDERTPPAMDVQAYSAASTREFGMDAFYANYLADLPPGTALPDDAGNAQQPDMAGGQVTLAWTLYEQYGDRTTLAAQYPAMKAFVDTNNTQVPSHIWPDNRGFGDWCPPVHDGGVNGGQGGPNEGNCTSEVSLVNTALSYVQALDVAKAAQALGKTSDAATYTALANGIKQAFNTHFLNADGSSYGDGRQTTSILPLAFDMVPAGNVTAVGNRLVDTILTTNGGHLDTGIFGTRHLVDALARINRTDVAMTVLDQKTYPGFGYEISRGATSSWEEWLYSSNMETHDHAMFAGVNASLYTQLAGIQPAAPGYSAVSIAPQTPTGLAHVAASLDTAYGKVAVSWTKSATTFDLDVTIPVNTTATVSLPTQHGRTSHTVGSGHWHFHVTL